MFILKHLILAFCIFFSSRTFAQTEFGLEWNAGITMMRSTKTAQESPKGYYKSHLEPQVGNWSINSFLIRDKSMFELAFNKSYFFMNSTDRLLSFASGFDTGRGFYFSSGLISYTFRFF